MSYNTFKSNNYGYATNSYLLRPVTRSIYRSRLARETAGAKISKAFVAYRRRARARKQYKQSTLGLAMAMRRRGFPRDLTRHTAVFIKPTKFYAIRRKVR